MKNRASLLIIVFALLVGVFGFTTTSYQVIAQDDRDKKIDELQKQINELQQKIDTLKNLKKLSL